MGTRTAQLRSVDFTHDGTRRKTTAAAFVERLLIEDNTDDISSNNLVGPCMRRRMAKAIPMDANRYTVCVHCPELPKSYEESKPLSSMRVEWSEAKPTGRLKLR